MPVAPRFEGRKEMFYLTTHSIHFIYVYMASDILLRTILIVRKETRCRHIGYSFRLTARVLLYAPSHRQDSTYHSLCYTSRGALAGTRNSSMGPPHEGSVRRPMAPWANALTTELHLAPPRFDVIDVFYDVDLIWFSCFSLDDQVTMINHLLSDLFSSDRCKILLDDLFSSDRCKCFVDDFVFFRLI